MPISSPAAGTDAARFPLAPPQGSPEGRSGGLTLDYRSGDHGPSFRRALAQAAAPTATPAATPAMPAAPAPGPEILEGADALSQLRRDLFSGSATLVDPQPAGGPDDGAVAAMHLAPDPVPVPADSTALVAAPPAEPVRSASWHHDGIEGRRLGDRPAAPAEGGDGVGTWLFGEDGLGFDDLIDVINPLQHIPIVSSIYRWITGDEMSPAANVAGGALFGGPIGLAGAMAGVAFEEATGRDLGGHALAMIFGEDAAGTGDAPASAATLAAAPAGVPPLGNDRAILLHSAPAGPAAQPAQLAAERLLAPAAGSAAAPILFIPAPPALADEGGPAAAGAAPSPADAAIAAQMMQALDKYEALARQRSPAPAGGGAAGPAAGSLFDGRL